MPLSLSTLLVTLIFLIGIFFSLILFVFWLANSRKDSFALYWGLGFLLWNWSQIPTMLSLSGESVVLTDFNLFFAITIPLSFLARIFIHFGLRSVLGYKNTRKVVLQFLAWFVAFILYYIYFFVVSGHASSEAVFYEMVLFFIPMSLLSMYWIIREYRKNTAYDDVKKTAFIFFILFTIAVIANYVYFIFASYIYPIELFHVLVRASYPYLAARLASMVLLFINFILFFRLARFKENSEKMQVQ